jgi:hypothetical protein
MRAFGPGLLFRLVSLLTMSIPQFVQARKFIFPAPNASGDFLMLEFEATASFGFVRAEVYLQNEQGPPMSPEFGNWKIVGAKLRAGRSVPEKEIDPNARATAERLLSIISSGDEAALQGFYSQSLGDIWRNGTSSAEFSRSLLQISRPLGALIEGHRLVQAASLGNLPGTDRRGTFLQLSYRARYRAGPVAEDVNLERSGGSWKVIGAFLRRPL